MEKELTEEEIWVREELTKLYPQLQINCQKTLGTAYEKYGGDLLALCIEFFLNKPIDVQVKSFKEGKAENFITYMMGMQSKSSSSKWYLHYRRHHEMQREYYPDHYLYDQEKEFKWEDDDQMLCIKQAISKLNPYEKMLIEKRVIQGMQFTEIAEDFDIPYSSLSTTLRKTLEKIKQQCKHFNY